MNTPLLVANMVFAAVASGVNLWAAWRSRDRAFSPMRWVRGWLAMFYAGLYMVQVTGLLERAAGVDTARVLNLATWVVVWMLPALVRSPQCDSQQVADEVVRRLHEELTGRNDRVA